MIIKYLQAKLAAILRKLYRRDSATLSRQRLTLLLFCYLPVLLTGVLANFLGLTQPSAAFFNYTHGLLLAAAMVFLALYCQDKIKIGACLSAFTIIGQGIVSVEMVYCALRPTPYYTMLIMANMVLLTMNMMVSMAASLRTNTEVLGLGTLAVYIACALLSGDALLKSFIPIFAIAFTFVSLIGVWMARSISRIDTENQRIKKEETELLHLFRLKKNELNAFVSLATDKYSHDGTKALMERLTPQTRQNLLSSVEEYILARKTDLGAIARAFPELSPSEREIARLVIQGKKLNEVCTLLHKNESNINSQRANMRRKLGLKPAENLRDALQRRMDGAK